MKNLIKVLIVMTLVTSQGWMSSMTVAQNRIRGWMTYRNKKFGFSIKYPSTWQADGDGEHNPLVMIHPRNPKPHEFYITISVENRTIDQVRETFIEFTRISPASRFKEREIHFANERAYQFTRTDNPGFYAVYIPLSDRMYVVSAARFDMSEVRRAVGTFNLRRD